MMPETDDDAIVREEAVTMDAEGDKRAAEDKAEADASSVALEKSNDAARPSSEREPVDPPADAMSTMTQEEADALARRPPRGER